MYSEGTASDSRFNVALKFAAVVITYVLFEKHISSLSLVFTLRELFSFVESRK